MKNIIVRLNLLLLLSATLGACSSNDTEDSGIPTQPVDPTEIPIGFGAASGKSMENSRSNTDFVDDTAFKTAGKFYVYSNYDYNLVDGAYTETVPEFQKQEVNYDNSNNKWTYTPKRYWSGAGAYHFRACFPTTADIVTSSNGKNLVVSYSIHKDNYDLMVAYHHRDMANYKGDKTEPVNLIFNHALSAIRIKMKAAAGKNYYLKSLHFNNLYSVGTFSYDLDVNSNQATNDPKWSEKLYENWFSSYIDTEGNSYKHIGTNSPQDLITDEQDGKSTYTSSYLFAIPQELDPDRELPTKLTFTIDVDGQDVTTVKTLPRQKWLPGQKYTYLIHVKPGAQTTIEVITTQWDAVDATSNDIIIE